MMTKWAVVLAMVFVASGTSIGQQSCGSVEPGGKIPEGGYAGAGSSKEAAMDSLEETLGMAAPDCGPCSGRGCGGSVNYEAGQILFGTPMWDFSTGQWVQAAAVEPGGANWDKVCSSCVQSVSLGTDRQLKTGHR